MLLILRLPLGTVVVLAAITWWYARSAKRQASAAESQAKAATKQAETAEKQLAVLQSQILEQAGIATATLNENVKELHNAATHWLERMEKWGQLGQEKEVELLPPNWAGSLEHAKKIAPRLYEQLAELQRSSKTFSRSVDQFTSKASTYGQIKKVLSEIIHGCEAIINRFLELD